MILASAAIMIRTGYLLDSIIAQKHSASSFSHSLGKNGTFAGTSLHARTWGLPGPDRIESGRRHKNVQSWGNSGRTSGMARTSLPSHFWKFAMPLVGAVHSIISRPIGHNSATVAPERVFGPGAPSKSRHDRIRDDANLFAMLN